MNKLINSTLAIVMLLGAAAPALALESTSTVEVKTEIEASFKDARKKFQEEKKEVQKKLQEERKELDKKFKEERKELQEKVKEKVKELKSDWAEKNKKLRQEFARRSLTVNGELTAIGGTQLPTTLTVRVKKVNPRFNPVWESVSSTYPQGERLITVNVNSATNFVRRYWGKSSLDELTVGDSLHLVGSLQPDGTLTARTVKDDSIHVTQSVHKGYITELDSANQTFVMNRANTTTAATAFKVKVTSSTVITVPGIEKPTFADLKLNNRVAVYGIINNRTRTIEARQVRILQREAVRVQITLNGELVSLSGTSLPATMVVKASKISPSNKYPELNAIYPTANKDISVKVTDDTVIVRQFWGKSNLGEFTTGDKLHIVGRLQDDGTIAANLVQNDSIRLMDQAKSGTIGSVDAAAGSLMMTDSVGASFTVKVSANTKIVLLGVTNPTIANLKVGDKVSVAGVLNDRTKVIMATEINVTLTPVPVPAPAPAPTSTASST